MLGGDIVVAGNKKVLAAAKPGRTRMVVNTAEVLPGDFTRNADFSLPTERLKRAITTAAGAEKTHFIDAARLATALLGQSIGANMFMLGYAYQLGALPLSAEAIEQALELNGEAVAMNVAAFRWGRRAAVDPAAVEAAVRRRRTPSIPRASSRSRSTKWLRAVLRSSPTIRMPPMPRATGRWSSKLKAAENRKGARQDPDSPTRSRAICSS